MAFSVKHDWPLLAVAGAGAGIWYFTSSGAASAPGKTIWPRIYGGEQGTPSRQLSKTSDSGQLAAEVIGDVVNQQTTEDQLQTEQNIAYRETNAQVQESLNAEQPPPNGWTQILQSLIGGAAAFFGGPVGAGVLGVQPQTGSGGFNPFSWFGGGSSGGFGGGNFFSPFGSGWGGYYPSQWYPSPYSSGEWA